MGGKKVLVVDVDETLLNIEPLFFLKRFKKDYPSYDGELVNFSSKRYYMVPRPRIREFLEKARNFDLIAFSVVNRDITIQKLEILGIKNFFVKIYGKEDLINKKKSLKMVSEDLNIPINNIIAIDDMPGIFMESSNIIPVKPFLMGKNDEYEYQEHDDNLLGAINQALKQGIKVVSPVD